MYRSLNVMRIMSGPPVADTKIASLNFSWNLMVWWSIWIAYQVKSSFIGSELVLGITIMSKTVSRVPSGYSTTPFIISRSGSTRILLSNWTMTSPVWVMIDNLGRGGVIWRICLEEISSSSLSMDAWRKSKISFINCCVLSLIEVGC